jgi:mannose-6-phosphate isomerase-like protein (cupin superfamily)
VAPSTWSRKLSEPLKVIGRKVPIATLAEAREFILKFLASRVRLAALGLHHHAGPGIRCITAGELTFVMLDKSTVYRAGDCFFEAGNVTHSGHNAADKPVVLLQTEILPASWSGGSLMPPK